MDLILTTPEALKLLISEAIDERLAKIPVIQPEVKEIVDNDVLCKRLNVSESTIARMRKRRQIPFMQIGGVIRYDYNAVVKALENKNKK